MKREQAERMMRVYTDMVVEFNSGKNSYVGMDDAIKLVRELIIDAMCDDGKNVQQGITYKSTYPNISIPTGISNPDEFGTYKTVVTC